jgi:hypothetical protein
LKIRSRDEVIDHAEESECVDSVNREKAAALLQAKTSDEDQKVALLG